MSWRRTTRSHPYTLRNRVVSITGQVAHAPAVPAAQQSVALQPAAQQPVAHPPAALQPVPPQPAVPQPIPPQPAVPQVVATQAPVLDHNAVQAVPQSIFGGAISNNNSGAGGIGSIQVGTANAGSSVVQANNRVIPQSPSLTGCHPDIRRLIFEFVFGRWEYVEARDALPLLLTSRLFRREAGRLAFQYVHFPLDAARWSLNLANPANRQTRLDEINNALGPDHRDVQINTALGPDPPEDEFDTDLDPDHPEDESDTDLDSDHQEDAGRFIVQRFSAEHNGPLDTINYLVNEIEATAYQINIRPQGPGALHPSDEDQNREDIREMITRVSHHTVTNARLTTLTIHFWGNQWDLFERLVGPAFLIPEWGYPRYRFELANQPTRRPELVHNQRLLLHFRATPEAAAQGFRNFDVYFAREPRPPTFTHTDGTDDNEAGPGNEIVPDDEPALGDEIIPDHELDPDNAIVPDGSSNPASGMITNGEPDLNDQIVPDGEHDPANIITGSSESEANLGHYDPQLSAFELQWINFGRETDTAEEAQPDAQNGPETIGAEGGQEEPDMEDEAGDLEMEDDAEDLEMEDEDEDLYS